MPKAFVYTSSFCFLLNYADGKSKCRIWCPPRNGLVVFRLLTLGLKMSWHIFIELWVWYVSDVVMRIASDALNSDVSSHCIVKMPKLYPIFNCYEFPGKDTHTFSLIPILAAC